MLLAQPIRVTQPGKHRRRNPSTVSHRCAQRGTCPCCPSHTSALALQPSIHLTITGLRGRLHTQLAAITNPPPYNSPARSHYLPTYAADRLLLSQQLSAPAAGRFEAM